MISILYVEDEPFLGKIVKETLESKGYRVVHLTNGAEAVNHFDTEEFDIAVLDIMLPHKSGYDIAKDIRAKSAHFPILFLSAKDQTQDVVKGFQSGGNDYIRKPFSMEELIVRIENLTAFSDAKTSISKDLKLTDTTSYAPGNLVLTIAGESTSLSHKEAQILTLLCQHKNAVLDRKQILMEVWSDDSYFNSRTLDVYIRKLRKLLSRDPLIQIITLKGVGYRFVVN